MILTITEAAHKYGLDHFSGSAWVSIFGKALNTESVPGTGLTQYVTHWSNGFDVVSTAQHNLLSITFTEVKYVKAGTQELIWHVEGSFSVNWPYTYGLSDTQIFSEDDTLIGNSFSNTLLGHLGDDNLRGGEGNDYLDGGAGTDTAVLSGTRGQYKISKASTALLSVGPDGTDTLVSIERLQFTDSTVAYDTSGAAGQAYRLYQAAFNRAPDIAGLGYQMNVLDNGTALTQVAEPVMNFVFEA